ncbi:hypothetical protein HBB16_08590 [Pseudonocardia sp. MCCB 268]|nr:hypothetical protein [Pseudonocardia cytotoxica]
MFPPDAAGGAVDSVVVVCSTPAIRSRYLNGRSSARQQVRVRCAQTDRAALERATRACAGLRGLARQRDAPDHRQGRRAGTSRGPPAETCLALDSRTVGV